VDAQPSSQPSSETPGPGDAGPVLEARGIVREFGALRAVNGVDFELTGGEHLVVFGPNGAGKTTLLRVLSGGLRPTEGEVLIAGKPLLGGDRDWLRRIGVL